MTSNKKVSLVLATLALTLFAVGCGGESKEEKQADANAAAAQQEAKQAREEAKQARMQAKKQAKQAKKMSKQEKKQAKAAAAAAAGEKSAEEQASASETAAANAQAQAAAAQTAATRAAAAKAKKKANGNSGGNTTSCGGGIMVDASTSCGFAKNVVQAYRKTPGPSVVAYSPTTDQAYTMKCSGSQMLTTCSGGVGASVTFEP